jgi:hypothetical protein
MNWQPLYTTVLIGLLTLAGIAFDIVIYCLCGNDCTLSKAMQRIGRGWPIIIVVYGGLGAHFFCPRDACFRGWWSEIKPYALLAAGVFVFRISWALSLRS